MNSYIFPYFGPLILHTSINKEQIERLKKICNTKQSYHTSLAGHIKDEYLLNSKDYEKIVKPQLNLYKNVYEKFYDKELISIKATSVWVNYMKAGEFNPPHIHTNCRFSSVVYLQFPKQILKENEKHQAASKGPGAIEFMYGENQPRDSINSYPVLPKEGDMFIFPSFVTHFVYPFKSKNVKRISIAANFD
tara:strand:- start:60 stop:632 length:573 start_codon:yes stop_codon:yes gene_type:complete